MKIFFNLTHINSFYKTKSNQIYRFNYLNALIT